MNIEQTLRYVDQRDLDLVGTRACADMVRTARAKGASHELVNELFKLMEMTARMEWGPDTTIDDFSDPPYFVVNNSRKQKQV